MGTQDPQGTQNSSTMKCNSYRLKHHPSYKIQSHPRKCIQEQKLQVEEATINVSICHRGFKQTLSVPKGREMCSVRQK